MASNLLLVLVASMLLFAALFVIPTLMSRRAARIVIKIFCGQGATDALNARTEEELGLAPLGIFDRMTKTRDYKPQALRFLKEAGIVRTTEDGRLYLSQDKLLEEVKCRKILGHQLRHIVKRRARFS
jgi:hypothetical protein